MRNSIMHEASIINYGSILGFWVQRIVILSSMLLGLCSEKFDFFVTASIANCILWVVYFLGLSGVSVRNGNLAESRHRRNGLRKFIHYGFLLEILDYLKVVGLQTFFAVIQLLLGMKISGRVLNWNWVLFPLHIYSVILGAMGIACVVALKYTFFDKYGKS